MCNRQKNIGTRFIASADLSYIQNASCNENGKYRKILAYTNIGTRFIASADLSYIQNASCNKSGICSKSTHNCIYDKSADVINPVPMRGNVGGKAHANRCV